MKNHLQIEVLRHWREVASVLPEWSSLWDCCPHATPFQRPEWLFTWMEIFQPEDACIVLIRHEGVLVGFAPFLIFQHGRDRVLGLMGGGISDYLDILISPQLQQEVLEKLWDRVNEEGIWSSASLSDLSHLSPLLRWQPSNSSAVVHDVCPLLQLPSSPDGLRSVVPGEQLRNLRNARARLDRAGGGTVETCNPATLEGNLEAIFRLHDARWSQTGQHGVLCDARVQDFHRKAAARLLCAGMLGLYSLRHQGRIIATLYALYAREKVYCYLQGFDPEFSFFSPGTLILGAALEDAIRLKKSSADFLRGAESYKYKWGATDQVTYRVQTHRCVKAREELLPRVA